MADIFVLQGASDHGKTKTIRKVYCKLHNDYPKARVTVIYPDSMNPNDICNEHWYKDDISVIMDNVNGLKVGVETRGDYAEVVKEGLKRFYDEGCNIIFCATRTRGGTIDVIKSYKNDYDILYIRKPYVARGKDVANEKMASQLIRIAGL
jgi:hypothetical protein